MAHSSWVGWIDLQGWCRVMWTLKSDYCTSCAQWGTAWACTESDISILSQQKNYLQICYSLHFVSKTKIYGGKQSFISALNCGNLTDLPFPGMCENTATLLSRFSFLILTNLFSVTGHQWNGANWASRLAECHAVCYSNLQILWNLNPNHSTDPWDTTNMSYQMEILLKC